MSTRCILLYLAFAMALSSSLAQTTYYVASSGNDSNNGRSGDTPFQTIDKINSLSLQPGDQILFRRGDTFRGSLNIRQSGTAGQPIIVDAYGSGNKPVLSGSIVLTNWQNIGNNVWQTDCPACGDRVTGLFRDNSSLPLGRYPNLTDPNKGYLTVQSHAGKNQLTSQQSLSTNWTGGEAVYRPVQWILNRAKITQQSGNTLFLENSSNYDISDNWGYFIQNHPATLDQTGEWYYDSVTKKIRLFDNQSNPNSQAIAATVFADVVTISNVSSVTIRNLQITQALANLLSINNSSNLVVAGNDFTQSGEDGIVVQGSGSQLLIENNSIENINNNGVYISPYQNVTFRGNTIRTIGLTPGRGKSGDGMYVGFQSNSTANTLIENNVVDNIGYTALNFSTNTTIQHNQISNFCLTKSDGGGLYIWNGNQQPLNGIRLIANVVYNGIGASEGLPSGTNPIANGIYLDNCASNIEVVDNSVYNCRNYGFLLHGASNIRMTGNTAYNNNEAQLFLTNTNGCQPRNMVLQNNIFVSRLPSQLTVKYETNQNDLASYGQFNNNVYARPFDDTNKLFYYTGSTGGHISLTQWQNLYGQDLSSTNSPVTYSSGNPDDYIKYVPNPSSNAIQVPLDGTYRDARNNVRSGTITVPPFSSVVLLKDLTQATPLRPADNPANAVVGLNYSYYEQFWTALPDFNSLTPAKSGITSLPDLSVRGRDDSFGLRFTGYINVPTDGAYTFFTNSDDGSKLFIGNTQVVDNDGGHAEQERSGTIGLKAGLHAITIVYFEGGGGQALSVSYAGPGIDKQTIPANQLYRVANGPVDTPQPTDNLRPADNPANAVVGLNYNYYEQFWTTLPDFNSLTPAKSGITSLPDLSVRDRDDSFGLRFTGYVSVLTDGVYTFFTNSDDGSKLFIGNTQVVDNDGGHAEQERSGTIGLKAGLHAITIVYFEGGGSQALSVSYAGPGMDKQIIPANKFFRVANGQGRIANELELVGEPERGATMYVYPVPARENLWVRYYAETDGEATIQLVNTAAQPVLQTIRNFTPGENLIKLTVDPFLPGHYVVIVTHRGKRSSRKVLLSD